MAQRGVCQPNSVHPKASRPRPSWQQTSRYGGTASLWQENSLCHTTEAILSKLNARAIHVFFREIKFILHPRLSGQQSSASVPSVSNTCLPSGLHHMQVQLKFSSDNLLPWPSGAQDSLLSLSMWSMVKQHIGRQVQGCEVGGQECKKSTRTNKTCSRW